jgi:hypothetical protein
VAAGICKRCGTSTGNPDGRQWYCESCRVERIREYQREAARAQANLKRKPCAMCGGDKGPGERRWYCDVCEPIAREVQREKNRQRQRDWLTDPSNREHARRYSRERERSLSLEAKRVRTRSWYHRQKSLDPVGFREKARQKNAAHRADRNPDLIDYSEILRGDPCSYCGGPMDLVEHIHTRSTGGTNTWDNVTAGCTSCNGMKRNKSLLHALLHINQ